MGVISIVDGDYKPTNITGGAPPCGDSCHGFTWVSHEKLVLFHDQSP